MQSLDPTFPLYPTFAFIGFLASIIPLTWHIQAWNAGTCSYMIWTAIACLIEFVNCIVWKGHALNLAPVWCDISSKLLLGAGTGIPAAALCIARRLYIIASVQTASVTRRDKRRAVICDLLISVGVPVIVMVLHVVVQAHRFDILQDIGCYPVIYNTLLSYFLVFQWPVLLGCISFVYSALALRQFWLRRIQFSQLLSHNSSLNASRYFRLMILAVSNMLFTIPLGVYSIYIGTKGVQLAPWVSWEETHFNFGRVVQIPTVIWRSDPSFETAVEMTRWIYVVSALIFFALFGFASEAQKNYANAFWCVASRVGIKRPAPKMKHSLLPSWRKPVSAKVNVDSQASMPVFMLQKPTSSEVPTTSSLTRASSRYSSTSSPPTKSIPLTSPTPSTPPPEYTNATKPKLSTSSPPHTPQGLPQSVGHSTLSSDDRRSDCFTDVFVDMSEVGHVQLPPLSSTSSAFTVSSMHSLDRVYMSHAHTGGQQMPSSPTPDGEADVVAFHRPFASPDLYPKTQPRL